MTFKDNYEQWLKSDYIDEETKKELKSVKDEKEIEDRFYRELEFGTGGLRGIISAGSNRMNIYTIGKATQGLADYLNKNYTGEISVSIAYDSRNMSKEFSERAASVLCANGIIVNLFESLRPTPVLSYTVRHLKSKAGIVITASHNPKEYNGYKVYNEDGGQVTDKAAKEILDCISKITEFKNVKAIDLGKAKEEKLLNIIGEEVDKTYIDKVKALTIREELVKKNAKDVKVIYTPIHGSGNVPVRRVLKELGYDNVFVVKDQELPNGNFPTAPYPNPEQPSVFELALKMAEDIKPDVIFGTDPDCDRIGVVVKDKSGEYRVLTGNQTGVLLTHYIISSLKELNKLPENGAVIKTIVTSEMTRKITEDFNVELIDVLTGFKYIGEKIKEFEKTGSNTYLFGFEESYGCLAGTFVRDKDAVIGATLICEMVLYYKNKGLSLYDALIDLYEKYGFYKESLVSLELKGKEGQEKIQKAIENLRHELEPAIDGVKIVKKFDYKLSKEKDILNNTESVIELPKSNVLKFILEDGSWFVVRPSGTEPKMKVYMATVGKNLSDADEKMDNFNKAVMEIINKACEN
ncbi:phosphoglucomutase [Clostridium pasteurianum DSM 525 = ATCC 6013]|uniref:phosphoglucomutase (alpha-D-glucose-1,6-bisphosphate-dependent) n=1 Tax=Clostridium pasteurianum DSM 525 = ATCC 6013 TaxID=1262449 RepID=A0A0H3J771_CLOPA|nr:phospho-sugar mutase [Clostridium pasteurianum]AJA47763.1 phosphoglucomutase [Clostridium pasteurianum DSM 525 = ATCC 6013]AJA51751.1 phosphoglucomutase [Clostridium pasteurianum DSM 525 = ATCC 6013]AOZ75060.1 phosphoglucomutase [Clostridium pasteurianum DSM 525 = ATCC 6013]AOZ78855.1 phosphoglucomutase [Clostridium pasteurianum]ELP59664.1 phosphoglucomutase [Clostridium pasteurianum DSM 525 = ATCC 6013]